MTRQYGSIPMKMAVTGTDPYVDTINSSLWSLAPAAIGQTWTMSVYAKASVSTTGELLIFEADSSGAIIAFDVATISITASWTRFSLTYTTLASTCAFIQVRLDGTPTGGSGINIWWDGLQVERASAATNFNPYYFGNTSWRDTSGNGNNGTLTNNPTYSAINKGTVVFPGTVENRVQTSYGPTFTDFTVSLWFKDNNSVQFGRLIDKNYIGGFWLGRNGSTANSWGGGIQEASGPYGIYLTLTDGQWHFLTSIRSGTTHILYGDGINNTTSNTVSATALDSTTLAIGAWSGGINSQYFIGNISIVMMYNRALSATEVLQNYEATKTRFGL
jgi:hypothetical protein